MNEQWQRPAPAWVRAAPLALVVVGIIAAFVYTKKDRANERLDRDLDCDYAFGDTPLVARVTASHVTSDLWNRIASLESLRSVNLSAVQTIDEGIERLAGLPDLENLTMGGQTFVDDDVVQRLSGNTTLKRLYINDCRGVTDASIDVLIGWKSLDTVLLDGTSVTFDGLRRLREARRDLILRADWCAIARSAGLDCSPWAGIAVTLNTQADVNRFLELLDLRHNWQTGQWQDDPGVRHKEFRVSGHAAGPALPELAAAIGDVESLMVHTTRIAGDVGNWSDKLSSLRVMSLADGSDLSGFARCRSLSRLELYEGRESQEIDLDWMTELPELKELVVQKGRLSTADLELISQLDSLETLSLGNVDRETLRPLLEAGRLPHLWSLSIQNK